LIPSTGNELDPQAAVDFARQYAEWSRVEPIFRSAVERLQTRYQTAVADARTWGEANHVPQPFISSLDRLPDSLVA
jgi:hypothetical protein